MNKDEEKEFREKILKHHERCDLAESVPIILAWISSKKTLWRKETLLEVLKAVEMADIEAISHYGSAGAGLMYASMRDYLKKEIKKL